MKSIHTSQAGFSRRSFLRGLALAGASAALPRWVDAETPFELLQGRPALKLHDDISNAEPNLARLVQSWVTPVDQFYVRSHAPAPKIDPGAYRLKISGLVDRELTLSMSDLMGQFGQSSVMATLQCAGNRRDEFNATAKVGGVQWGPGAIGNANWTGLPLGEVLKAAGVQDGAKHIQFAGLDEIKEKSGTIPFGASIPVEKALSAGTLLAYAMNGETLPPDHGFPLRALVPGHFGVRSVKWLDTIIVSAEESPNHYHQEAYKIMPKEMNADNVDWSVSPPLYEMIVNSVIATVDVEKSGATPTARLRGYAVATGHADDAIEKVEITADGGKTWQRATLTSTELPYCWRLWEAQVPLNSGTKAFAVCATTRNGARQPQNIDWNFKGYGFNAWHSREI